MSSGIVMNNIETFFWAMVKQRQFTDTGHSIIDLEVSYHPSMELYIDRVNELLRSCDSEGFKCFVNPVDPYEDKESWELGAMSQLFIPYFLVDEKAEITKPSTDAVMGYIAVNKHIFDDLPGINPFEYFLMDGDEWKPVIREVFE